MNYEFEIVNVNGESIAKFNKKELLDAINDELFCYGDTIKIHQIYA